MDPLLLNNSNAVALTAGHSTAVALTTDLSNAVALTADHSTADRGISCGSTAA